MSTTLVKNAEVLVTMDDERRENPGGGFPVRDGLVEQVASSTDLPPKLTPLLRHSFRESPTQPPGCS